MSSRTFEQAEDILAATLANYEPRENQRAFARAVQGALTDNVHLIAEASCGTGKSIGYLIPAILTAVSEQKRIIVSTETKALQDQIANKDLPFLAEHLTPPFLARPFTYALLKGRTNYACFARVMDPEVQVEIPGAAAMGTTMNDRAGEPGFLGERDDFPTLADRDWHKVTTSADQCPGKRECPFGEVCLSEKAKAKARASDIVVVNHALYLTDLKIRMASEGAGSMLDAHDAVIADECHGLESVAGNVFGVQVTEAGIRDTCSKVTHFVRRSNPDLISAADQVVSAVTGAMAGLWAVLANGRVREGDVLDHADEFIDLVNTLGDLAEFTCRADLMEMVPAATRTKSAAALTLLIAAARGQHGKVKTFVLSDFTEYVRWVEEEKMNSGGTRKVLKVAPISVAKILRDNLFAPAGVDHPVTAIMVSATASVGGSFDYLTSRLGVDHPRTLDVGSPFDFTTQAAIYVPRHLPDPGKERAAWASMAISEMGGLIKASRGRALVLFTSYSAMKMAYETLAPRLPYTCLMQGQQSNKALAAAFASDTHSVLFGTRSFMTGFDIQGEALSLVVIDRLPFPVPTEPITEARCEAIKDRGGSDFSEYTVPVMSLVLQQAFGRLIRHRDDRGVVAILDPRVLTKGYGKKILASLPKAPLLLTIEQVQTQFANFDAEVQTS